MEVKPVKIFVYKDLLELMDKYDCKGLIDLAVENVIIRPYPYVMRTAGSYFDFDYSEAEPVEVYMDKDSAIAWELTPKEVKDRLLSVINEETELLIYGFTHLNQCLEGGKKA